MTDERPAGAFPLLPSQLGIRDGQMQEPDNPAYIVCQLIQFRGDTNIDALRRSIEQVLLEAETMCVRIGSAGGSWWQVVDQSIAGNIEFQDFTRQPDPEKAFRTWVDSQLLRPMTLVGGQLSFTYIVRVGPANHYFLQWAHHVVADGYSGAIMRNRLAEIYNAIAACEPIPKRRFGSLRALATAPADAQPDNYGFWSSYLKGAPTSISFTDHTAGPAPRAIIRRALLPGIQRQVGDWGLEIRWQHLCLAALAAYVAIYTGNNEAVVGVNLVNRHTDDERRTPAMLVTTLPMRVPVSADLTIAELSDAVKQLVRTTANHHRQRPEALRTGTAAAWRTGRLHGPIINVVPFLDAPQFTDLAVTSEEPTVGAIEDVVVSVFPSGSDDVRLEVAVNPRLYSAGDAERHLTRMSVWLQRLLNAGPSSKALDQSILSDAELALHDELESTTGPPDLPLVWDEPTSAASLAQHLALTGVSGMRLVDSVGRRVPLNVVGNVRLLTGSAEVNTELLASHDGAELYYRGPADERINVRGQRIELGDLRRLLDTEDGVADFTIEVAEGVIRVSVAPTPGTRGEDLVDSLRAKVPLRVRLSLRTND